jgi:hypothetical protein
MSSDDVTMHRHNQLALRAAELVGDLQQRPPAEMDAAFDQLVKEAVRFVPGAAHAGITITRRRKEVQTTSATGPYPAVLDRIQQRHQEGPCLAAAWDTTPFASTTLPATSGGRTTARRPSSRRQSDLICFRLFGDSQNVGALNFYAEQVNAFDDQSVEVGLLFAAHTALAWNTLRRDRQFRSALASRDVIGQAKGILMERFKIDAVTAFELLTRLSQESNTSVAEIAHRLVDI